ncbi:hypothetical protein JW824_13580 [bacterium]|nr:hypothetical protein [bacterium]
MDYTYLIGVLYSLFFWIFLFFINSNNRKNILLTSLVCAPAGPLSEFWNLKDYWSPTYLFKIAIGQWVFGIEDYLFAFAFSGICYGIYILITKQIGSYVEKKYTWFVSVKLMIIGIIFFVLMFMLTNYLKMNSVYAIVTILFLLSIIIFILHPITFLPSLVTGFIMAAYMFFAYWVFYFRLFPHLINDWWNHEFLSGLYILNIPVEEIIWSFVSGLFIGPTITYCMVGENTSV